MNPITLYPHQKSLVDKIRKDLVTHQHIIAVGPTGVGKTKIFLSITRSAVEKGTTVLIISESLPIFKQIRDEQHGRLIASGTDNLMIKKGGVYIAMAQTLKRRQKMIENFAWLEKNLMVIVDECHIGTPTKILEQLTNSYLLGFTATPDARVAKHLPVLYKHTTVGPQVQDVIDLGFLMPYKHFARVGVDMDELQIQNGEFTEASQEKAFEKRVVYDGLIKDLNDFSYKKVGIYCASIKHAVDTKRELTEAGFNCICYYSGVSESELIKFTGTKNKDTGVWENSIVDICVSVGTLTKGWDFGPMDLIVLLRKTNSLPLFCQICGRGSRLSPATNKTHFTVLDYGENFKQHGLWNADRDWELLSKEPKKKKKESPAPIKICPDCEAIVPASARVCQFCGHTFEKFEEENPPESKLVEITGLYETLKGRKVSQLSADELAAYAKLKNKRNFAIRVAKSHEQKNPGWMKDFGFSMGYKPAWYYMQKRDLPPIEEDEIKFNDLVLN